MDEALPFLSRAYLAMLAVLLFGRATDLASTYIATPNLLLEGNPIAKKLGWKLGIPLNIILSLAFAFWPLAAIVITTTSMLVAARNLQVAWLMRTLGEEAYRDWHLAQFVRVHLGLYLACLLGQSLLVGVIGAALIYFSIAFVPLAIGIGIVSYVVVVLFYTLLSVIRIRLRLRRT